MIENDKLHLLYLKKYCLKILAYMNNLDNSYENFLNNEMIQDSISFCLLQIGEISKSLSEQFIKECNNISFKEIIGMRNIIVHAYDKVDYKVVWTTCQKDINTLLEFINLKLINVNENYHELDINKIIK